MIEVPVRQDDRVDRLEILRQQVVDPPRLLARALVCPQVQQQPQAADFGPYYELMKEE